MTDPQQTPNADTVELNGTTADADVACEDERLLMLLRDSDCHPFSRTVVDEVWEGVIDVPSLHESVKDAIREALQNSAGDGRGVPRSLVVQGNPGYGKTHLIAWARQELMARASQHLPVVLPPYHPKLDISADAHIFRQVVKFLRKSRPHWEHFRSRLRRLCAELHDRFLRDGRRKDLGLGRKRFRQYFGFSADRPIAGRPERDQEHAIRRALKQEPFARALREEWQASAGVGDDTDGEILLAFVWLLFGDKSDNDPYFAERWLAGEDFPLPARDGLHLRKWCRGPDHIAAGVATIRDILGVPICLCFDQMEDMQAGLAEVDDEELELFMRGFSTTLMKLLSTPGVAHLFMFQQDVWEWFAVGQSPRHIRISDHVRDRMLQGTDLHILDGVDRTAAQELVRLRMQKLVWDVLDEAPPEENPFFPLTADEVEEIRTSGSTELRDVIARLRSKWEQVCTTGRVLVCELHAVTPPTAVCREETEVTLTGEHFPEGLRVRFGELKAEVLGVTPDRKAVRVCTPRVPAGTGEVVLRITGDNDTHIERTFLFVDPPTPERFSGEKLRSIRKEQGLTQAKVAAAIGCAQNRISRYELGKTPPSEEAIEDMAAFLGVRPTDLCVT